MSLSSQKIGNPVVVAATVFLAILCGSVSGADKPDGASALFPIRQDGKFGYINAAGEMVISPTFLLGELDEVRNFAEGLQVASLGHKYGYIDRSGKVVIKAQFDLARPFSEGLAAVRAAESPWKWGYIDKTGRYAIPPQFEEANDFSEGLAYVDVGGKSGYIDKAGAFIVIPQYTSSSQGSTFSEGLACVKVNEGWGFIDRQGKLVIAATLSAPSSFHEGLAVVRSDEKGSSRYGYIDKSGAFAFDARFSLAWRFSEGLARVEEGGAMAFIDTAGKVVFTVPDGDWAGEFSEGLVNVQIGSGSEERWGHVDRGGKWAIKPIYQVAKPFSHGLALVVIGNKMAYINKEGQYVWGPDSGNEALLARLGAQAAPEAKIAYEQEVLRLAKLVDPLDPPFTEKSFESGVFSDEVLRKLAAKGSEPARALLRKLLSYPPSPALIKLSPEMAVMQQLELQAGIARILVSIGDPFVVPTLQTWLADAVKGEGELNFETRTTLAGALDGLTKFHIEASVAQMEQLLQFRTLDRWTRNSILEAIARLSLPASRATLLMALKDEELDEHLRCAIAAALVRLGDPIGRQLLLQDYDLYLDGLRGAKRSGGGSSREELEFLGDAELLTTLKAKADAEPAGVPRNNITTLLDAMQISAMLVEKLKEVVTKGGSPGRPVVGFMSDTSLRLHALRVMGREGNVDLIPFLEELVEATDAKSGPVRYARSDLLNPAASSAIRQIRMRHWQRPDHS